MKTDPNASPADLTRRISAVEHEIAAIEHGGPPLAEVLVNSERELLRARDHFVKHGFAPVGAAPSERAHYNSLAMRGALMLIGGEAILASERQRLEALGGVSYDPERLRRLRVELRRLEAVRELDWRQREERGEVIDRSGRFSPEAFLSTADDLQHLADGQGDPA
jgi:hypothetical protein